LTDAGATTVRNSLKIYRTTQMSRIAFGPLIKITGTLAVFQLNRGALIKKI
jgi:hypothetical protein